MELRCEEIMADFIDRVAAAPEAKLSPKTLINIPGLGGNEC